MALSYFLVLNQLLGQNLTCQKEINDFSSENFGLNKKFHFMAALTNSSVIEMILNLKFNLKLKNLKWFDIDFKNRFMVSER